MITVLTVKGRKDSIEEIGVFTFELKNTAETYCDHVNTLEDEKYWTKATIVDNDMYEIRKLIPNKYKNMI